MSRLKSNLQDNLEKELSYGLFMAFVTKVIGSKVYLKDRFTTYNFSIDFNIEDKLDISESGNLVWINQCGEIFRGKEESLKESFTHFFKMNPDKTKQLLKPKKYWKAHKGEAHLFRFLTAVHGKNVFDQNTDYTIGNNNHIKDLIADEDYIRRLINNSYGFDSSIGGMLYITPNFEEKIHDYYVPAKSINFLKNINGNLDQINLKNNSDLYQFVTNMKDPFYKPDGYFSWNNIEPFLLNSKKIEITDL